jgi:hypothetical protein
MFKKFQALGKAIKSIKPNVPKTELQKKLRDLKIATQKSKAGKAKLDQTIFELKNNKDFTFKSKKGKSESNTESYKRITGENNKVIKNMLDKATEKKADGGRIGRKMGGGSDMGNTNVKKKFKGFSKLPETVQIKINKKLAKKV